MCPFAPLAGGTCYTQNILAIKKTFMKNTFSDTDSPGEEDVVLSYYMLWHQTPTDGLMMPKGGLYGFLLKY